jgi:hypothetical protein
MGVNTHGEVHPRLHKVELPMVQDVPQSGPGVDVLISGQMTPLQLHRQRHQNPTELELVATLAIAKNNSE